MLTDDIRELLKPPLSGTLLVITAGNVLRSDDGVGPYIAKQVRTPGNKTVILDAGDKPENIIYKAVEVKPARTVIIDAADFGGAAGDVRLIPGDSIPGNILSTHGFPMSIVSKVILEDTGSSVFFIGIQQDSVAFGEGLSPEVKKSAHEIIGLLSG